jgi:hypothetical protein
LTSFVVLWVAVAAWTFASPIGSGPDEPAHIIRAASLVRGQLVGQPIAHAPAALKSTVTVEAPQVFARLANDVGCFQFKPNVTAHCQGSLAGSPQDVAVYTYVGRYQPLYYALVGLPTLVVVSPGGMYLARLVSGALAAAMLALAVTSLRRCRGAPLLGAGLALAITPMALYLAAVINPSGLEIASAISAWVAAMAVASVPAESVSRSAVAVLGVSGAVLILTRALSPLWALFIAAALVALCPSVRALVRQRSVQVGAAVCVAAGLAALVWDLAADPFLTEPGSAVPPGASELHIVGMAFQRLDLLGTSTIGFFGWLDTPSPFGVILTWLAVLGVVVLTGVCLSGRLRASLVAAGTAVAWVVVPVVLIISEARSRGILGQGRDFMALGVGIPIVAATVAGERLAGRAATLRLATLLIAALTVCQVVDFYVALRRYTVGTLGPMNAFASVPNGWAPPLPALLLFVVFLLAIVAFGVLLRQAAGLQLPAADSAALGGATVTGVSAGEGTGPAVGAGEVAGMSGHGAGANPPAPGTEAGGRSAQSSGHDTVLAGH